MSGERSIPWTIIPFLLNGNAMRPVPIPNSSAVQFSARSDRKLTIGSITLGSVIAKSSSYLLAISFPK